MSLFDRARTTCYSHWQKLCILYRFRDIASYLSKVSNFRELACIWRPVAWVAKMEFHGDLWHQKTSPSCGVGCVMTSLAALAELRLVSQRQTQGYSIASRGKKNYADCRIKCGCWRKVLSLTGDVFALAEFLERKTLCGLQPQLSETSQQYVACSPRDPIPLGKLRQPLCMCWAYRVHCKAQMAEDGCANGRQQA